MDEETRRFDVELLADVFTDLDQITATVATGAGFRLVTMFNTGQFRREGIAAGAFVLTWRVAGFCCCSSSATMAAPSSSLASTNRSRCSGDRASLLQPKRMRLWCASSRVSC
jgi:hypothetical protein